ncbi:MAG: PAS domain S-box protein [Acidobacteria bacterium]|nr:PAS domain S-box protein [Acidobacteriota bacterium]
MTGNEIKSSKALEQELESLREKIAHIQSFVQQHEKESLLKVKKEPAPGEASDRFFCFIEEGPLGMAIIDSRYRIIRANGTFRSQLGYTPQEISSLEIPTLVQDDKTCLQLINQVFDKVVPSSKTEVKLLRKNGEYFWGQFTVCVSEQAGPDERQCLVIIEDINDRKQAEAVLQAEKQLLERLISSSVDGILAFDRELFFTVWNPAMERILGVSARKTLGRHAFTVCPFLKDMGENEHFEAALRGEKIISKDKRFTIPGTARQGYFEAYYGPMYGPEDGEIIGGLAIFRDITERILLEKSKRSSEERYRDLVENAYDMVYTHDLSGRITSLNKAAERILGYTRSEAYQMRFHQFVAPEFKENARKMLDRQLTGQSPGTQELQIVSKDGTRATLEVSNRLIFREGEAIGIQGIARDITERKKWEEALREANQKLENWVHELEQRTHEMTLLSEMGDILRACVNTKEVYEVIVKVAQEIFPVQGGALYVIGPLRNIVESVAEWGDTTGLELTFTPDECWALRRGRIHWIGDTRTGLLCKHLQKPAPSGYMCVPMMAQSEAVGILYLTQPKDVRMPEAKQKLAIAMAENVAMALSNLRLHETLRNQSIRDQLTGLFNRSFMEEALELEIRRAVRSQHPLTLIMLAVDNFKALVEQHGIEAGDSFLHNTGALLQANIRKGDIACRYSGQAFVLILPQGSFEVIRQRAENLRELIYSSEWNVPNGQGLRTTVSMGLAVFPGHGQTVEALLRSAEAALNRAGNDGGNRVVVAN